MAPPPQEVTELRHDLETCMICHGQDLKNNLESFNFGNAFAHNACLHPPTGDKPQEQCLICREGVPIEDLICLQCGHFYHAECLSEWWKSKARSDLGPPMGVLVNMPGATGVVLNLNAHAHQDWFTLAAQVAEADPAELPFLEANFQGLQTANQGGIVLNTHGNLTCCYCTQTAKSFTWIGRRCGHKQTSELQDFQKQFQDSNKTTCDLCSVDPKLVRWSHARPICLRDLLSMEDSQEYDDVLVAPCPRGRKEWIRRHLELGELSKPLLARALEDRHILSLDDTEIRLRFKLPSPALEKMADEFTTRAWGLQRRLVDYTTCISSAMGECLEYAKTANPDIERDEIIEDFDLLCESLFALRTAYRAVQSAEPHPQTMPTDRPLVFGWTSLYEGFSQGDWQGDRMST